jgi:hypothetical protein
MPTTRRPPRPVMGAGRLKAITEMPAKGKTWLAYRIIGNTSEKHDGVIRAHTREEAEVKAQVIFGCRTDAERSRVYVHEE